MNILELDSFNLADTVKFHDRLNHRLWDRSEHLHPEVRTKLLEIAKDFQEFLGVPDLDVKDITVSGSNAAYNYTPNSDIDLHLVIDLPEADHSEVYRELFDAKKFQYNAQHNIKIGGYDVELYVQNPNQEHHSQGIYSLLRNAWLSVPRRRKAEIDDISTRSKYEDLAARIEDTIRDGDHDSMADLMKKIKGMRQSGLEQQGEFGSDNLAFKLLRNNGYIKKLVDARNAARDRELSLAELAKPRQRVTYGFSENYKSYFKVPEKPPEEPKEKVFRNANEYEWFKLQQKKQPEKQPTKESPDGVDPTTKMFLEEPMSESPDGVNPTTKMFLDESDINSVLSRFFKNCIDFLEIKNAPKMVLHHNTDWSEQTGSFGQFDPDAKVLHLATSGRHVLDILRTMAHELTHCKQNEKDRLPDNAGETGSWWEDEANAMAGRIMRHWADEHPEMFKDVPLEESASGYIPKNKREARDPRYSMAVSVDIKPGQVGKEANKLALNTGRNGEPGLLMKSANLRESRMPQPSQGQGKYRDLNAPLGPEFKPTMPAGTVKVDVSDVYDWYKLGQHISNLKGLGQHDFGKGPPSTIISFGDEDTEHKYIQDLEKTGLTTTDIDPAGHKKKTGQKTDPTYNVAEGKITLSTDPNWYGAEVGDYKATGPIVDIPTNKLVGFEPDDKMNQSKSKANVEKIVAGLEKGDKLPPILVRKYKNGYQVLDGHHRFWAYKLAGIKSIPAQVVPAKDIEEKGKKDITKDLAESLRQELQMFEEQDLLEIKMTGKNLAQLARAIPGVMVGLEFEMIVPNVNGYNSEDLEPDYDQDERVRDIDDIVNFFDDGDYNGRNEIRRLRETLEDEYQTWVTESIDQEWYDNGMEFFQEFLDREYPFDRDDAFEEARDEIITANPDLPQESEEFQQLVSARVDEMEANYYVDQWEEQGSYYDYAREEFEDEQRDNYSESDWISNQGWRYASDVHTEHPVVSWPYWTSPDGPGTDAKEVALDFMNFMGYDTIAVGDYHGYGGGYELWDGDQWKKIGSNKPMDAFTVEPDGSLSGDDAGDTGLEFVSPPIPLAEIGNTMAKVQAWAAQNGVYTGKGNGTALHTNISIPGYSIDKLDYLKAALLLGDEHVLRDFDRITNTYAKPAIAKVRELVRNKPEKAQELLDKMKSQLNAEASKLIHSGSTDKYTSINTKDNRIEFRSPGGDYLSIIADNPQKMVDTINRMVVTLDAAMDPNKYKEEYQKKLYKLLTGQQFGRETKTGAKQEMKQDDKDLLNIFSRYAAGELPKQALKSFVRQAQLQRSVAKGKTGNQKMWWTVSNPAQSFASIEVVASTKEEAIQQALGPGGYPSWANTRNTVVAEPLRPYTAPPAGSELERIERQAGVGQGVSGLYKIFDTNGRLIAGDEYGSDRAALARAGVWAMQRGVDVIVKNAQGEEIGRVSASGEITPTAPQGTTVAGRPNNPEGNWYLKNGDTNEIFYRFNAADYADAYGVLQQWKQENPNSNINAMYGYGRDEPAQAAGQQRTGINYEIFRGMDRDDVVAAFVAADDQAAMERLARYRETHPGAEYNADRAPMPGSTIDLQRQRAAQAQQIPEVPLDIEIAPQRDNWSQDFERRMQQGDAAQGGIVDVAGEQPTQGSFTGEWRVVDANTGEELYRFSGVGNSQADANRVAGQWVRTNSIAVPIEVYPVMGAA